MREGKVSPDILKKLVFSNIITKREEVLIRPGIGLDSAAVDFGNYAAVLSMDPITAAAKNIGRLAVHVACNDIATCGIEPIGIMLTILIPPTETEEVLSQIMRDAGEAAKEINVEIIGGHTEVTGAVNRVVISTVAMGRAPKDRLITASGARVGDYVILTKMAGMEGTAILAYDFENELNKVFPKEFIERAKTFIDNISVVKEAKIAAKEGATAMHDVTEGGVFGAVWEICEASGVGVELWYDEIPVAEETRLLCDYFRLDPFKLISSGSLIITTPNKNTIDSLNQLGIKATVIGRITENGRFILKKDKKEELIPPDRDELYNII